jgi:putative membrane protein
MIVTEEDHERIAEAVARAEAGTSGEIRCVLAASTGNPPLSGAIGGVCAALAAPVIAVIAGWRPDALAARLQGWSTGEPELMVTLSVFIALQAVIFVAVAGLWTLAPVRRALIPRSLRRRAVRAEALEQFEALGLTHTREATGVLLFASAADHTAEVLADAGIWEKTEAQEWQQVVDLLSAGLARGDVAGGFVDAVNAAGALLKDLLPPREDDRNELPDALVSRGSGKDS